MTMTYVNEFDRQSCSVRILTDAEAALHYDDKALQSLYETGHAFINNNVEIYLEGCYHPAIVLTLDK